MKKVAFFIPRKPTIIFTLKPFFEAISRPIITATPAVGWHLAELLASGTVPETLQPFSLERFAEGALIDDAGIGPYPWRH